MNQYYERGLAVRPSPRNYYRVGLGAGAVVGGETRDRINAVRAKLDDYNGQIGNVQEWRAFYARWQDWYDSEVMTLFGTVMLASLRDASWANTDIRFRTMLENFELEGQAIYDRNRAAAPTPAPGPPPGPAPAPAPAPPSDARPTLRLGSRDQARGAREVDGPVHYAQRLLARAGQAPGAIDGVFGTTVETAVKAFQRARGVGVTGVVDAATWQLLEDAPAVAASPVPTPLPFPVPAPFIEPAPSPPRQGLGLGTGLALAGALAAAGYFAFGRKAAA